MKSTIYFFMAAMVEAIVVQEPGTESTFGQETEFACGSNQYINKFVGLGNGILFDCGTLPSYRKLTNCDYSIESGLNGFVTKIIYSSENFPISIVICQIDGAQSDNYGRTIYKDAKEVYAKEKIVGDLTFEFAYIGVKDDNEVSIGFSSWSYPEDITPKPYIAPTYQPLTLAPLSEGGEENSTLTYVISFSCVFLFIIAIIVGYLCLERKKKNKLEIPLIV